MQQSRSFFVALVALTCVSILQPAGAATLGESRKKCLSNELVGNEAVSACTFAIKLKPKEANLFVQRGIAWSKMGDVDFAIGDFSKAIKLNPHNSSAYYYRGVARETKGELEESLEDFRKSAELKPDDAEATISVERVAGAIAAKKAAIQASASAESAPPIAIVEAKAESEQARVEAPPAEPANPPKDDFFLLIPVGLLLAGAAIVAVARARRRAEGALETPTEAVERASWQEIPPPPTSAEEPAPPLAWVWSQYNK